MGAVTLDFLSVVCSLGIALVACVCQCMHFQGKTLLFHEHSEYFSVRKVTCILGYLHVLLKLILLKMQSRGTTRVQNLLLCDHFIEM